MTRSALADIEQEQAATIGTGCASPGFAHLGSIGSPLRASGGSVSDTLRAAKTWSQRG